MLPSHCSSSSPASGHVEVILAHQGGVDALYLKNAISKMKLRWEKNRLPVAQETDDVSWAFFMGCMRRGGVVGGEMETHRGEVGGVGDASR